MIGRFNLKDRIKISGKLLLSSDVWFFDPGVPLFFEHLSKVETEGQHLFTFAEQAVYNRPQTVDKIRPREGKDAVDAYQLVQRLQSMVRWKTGSSCLHDPWGYFFLSLLYCVRLRIMFVGTQT